MNILVLCHYGMYQRLDVAFAHQQAKEYVALGHQVKVLVPIAVGKKDWQGSRWNARRFEADSVEIVPVRYLSMSNYGKKSFNTTSAIVALKCCISAALDGFCPDMVHAHTLGFDSEIGAWLKGRLGCPLVVTTHGSDTSIPYEQGQKQELKRLSDAADVVVGVSSKLVDKLRSCGTKAELRCILNGFVLHKTPVETEKEILSILQVSHLQQQKRVNTTIQAFSQVKKVYPEATLTIVGQGPQKQELEQLCYDLSVEKEVCFVGQLPNFDVLREMTKHQFFVMPSVREGFGVVYLEAMASGCITIGSEGEGISDLIVSGENGFLVPPDDPDAIAHVIDWCIQNPKETAAIAERGRRDALELTWEENARKYITLFQTLVEENEEKHE